MHTRKHVIANWKMYMSFDQINRWCTTHHDALHELSQYVYLGITPEATAISTVQNIFRNTPRIMVGAQACSQHERGAHTGDISAQSLSELGCDICLTGHSEQRAYYDITSEDVAQQVDMLLKHQITPIVCVGETEQERNAHNTMSVISQQLHPIITYLNHHTPDNVYIAYEPRWAIGSGKTPSEDDIARAAHSIRSFIHQHTDVHPYILYGGSVSPENSSHLASINEVDGFLIGSASCDFNKLQQIITSTIHTGK